ncbi:hypothetical protein CC86DRAFT_402011 [Ophiobolus disseminans]|uniref:DUF7730 domain-containing protein n=1 Tax=Ophiobolus disseminans TaxID=1469910 RepID=A0A6A7ADV0_9PLEO|nr:hypothetical protein CC86DRAFT_402011 [Ophiobolus disseminans]
MSEPHEPLVDLKDVADLNDVQYQGSRTDSNKQTSRLLRLPAELRNRIYELALNQGNIQLFPGIQADSRPEDKPELALLRTCRQILSEASPIFYSINTFEFEFTFHILRFALSLTEQNRQVIRSIRLQAPSIDSIVGGRGGLDAIHLIPSLEELHFRGHLCGAAWDELGVTRLRLDGRSITVFAD